MSVIGCKKHEKAVGAPLSPKAMQILFGIVPQQGTGSQQPQTPPTNVATSLVKAVGQELGVDPRSAAAVVNNVWTLPPCQTMRAAGIEVKDVLMTNKDNAQVTVDVAGNSMRLRLTRTAPAPA